MSDDKALALQALSTAIKRLVGAPQWAEPAWTARVEELLATLPTHAVAELTGLMDFLRAAGQDEEARVAETSAYGRPWVSLNSPTIHDSCR